MSSLRPRHGRQPGPITRFIDLSPEAYERAAKEQAATDAFEAATQAVASATAGRTGNENERVFRRVAPGEALRPNVSLDKLEGMLAITW
jgi:hypothetical protein